MQDQIKARTKAIGVKVIMLIESFPQKPSAWILSKQILRCSTSIGSNYRAACRAKSKADFINKLKIVEEEADETMYWLEILKETRLMKFYQISKLMSETSEILAIIVASIRTSRGLQS